MGIRVSSFDFSQFMNAMLSKGHSQAEVDACFGDLLILLHDAEDVGRAHAMTEGADRAFHFIVSDTAGHLRLSAAIHGIGNVMVHDPYAYGTPAFDVAWENTRAAFAKRGINLPADYRAGQGSFRDAATCIREGRSVAEIQGAEGFRAAATCIREVRAISELQKAA